MQFILYIAQTSTSKRSQRNFPHNKCQTTTSTRLIIRHVIRNSCR